MIVTEETGVSRMAPSKIAFARFVGTAIVWYDVLSSGPRWRLYSALTFLPR